LLKKPAFFIVGDSPRKYTWLLVPAVVGLLLFLLLMPWAHPPAELPKPAARAAVIEESRLFLEQSGFDPGTLEPFIVFRTNDALLKRQVAHFGKKKLGEFIRNGFLRFIPSYHWQVTWIDTTDHEDVTITMESYRQPLGVTVFRTTHSPDGAILSLHMDHRGGTGYRRPDHLPPIKISEAPEFQDLRAVLKGTVWDNYMMRVDTTYRSEQHGERLINSVLVPQNEIFEHLPRITVRLNTNGYLQGIRQEVIIGGQPVSESESTGDFVRIIFFVIALLLLITLFVRRIFHRLVDMRSATIYGALGAILFALHMIQMLLQSTAFSLIDQQLLQIIALVLITIVVSVVVGIFVFMLSGLGESLSREVWPDKINTLSMLRLGYLDSSALGNSLAAGVLGSFFYLGLAALVYTLFDHSYLNQLDDQLFYADSYLFPVWQLFIRNLFWTILIAIGIFACFLSWVRTNRKNNILLLVSGGFAFTLLSAHQVITPGSPLIFAFWLVPGMAAAWFFLRQDLLAQIVAIFVFLLLWSTVDGRVVSGSPDALVSWSFLGIAGLFLAGGIVLSEYGKKYGHLPELTPAYILEIAREQRVERELEIAHQVHQSFLPVVLPKLDGMEVAASCHPAFDVGGDYYDVIPVDDNRMAFVVGDVSGKGIQAAFFMTMVKGIFQSLVKEIPEPVPLLTRMNRLFYDNARRGSFISICYGLLDVRDGSLRYARAGHNPAILMSHGDQKTTLLRSEGLAIGLTRNDDFERSLSEVSVTMSPKDTLLFYTDGVTEAASPSGQMFGEERLLSELARQQDRPADHVLTQLTASVKRFTASTPLSDDMTMVVVRKL
jgi:phosphoserine phosphatase RsbU/P